MAVYKGMRRSRYLHAMLLNTESTQTDFVPYDSHGDVGSSISKGHMAPPLPLLQPGGLSIISADSHKL